MLQGTAQNAIMQQKFCSFLLAAMTFDLRFLVFVCVAVLCLPSGCREDSSQAKKEGGYNLFDKKTKDPNKMIKRPGFSVAEPIPIIQGLQQAGDVEKRSAGRAFVTYCIFLAGTAVVTSGVVFWQIRRKKYAEWELNNPMALVKELYFIHQLSEPEKKLMQEISDKNSLSTPLQLFIEPKFLLKIWESGSFSASRPLVRRLLSNLFDIVAEGDEATVTAETNFDTTVYVRRT